MSDLVVMAIIGFGFSALGAGTFLAGSAFLSWQFKLRLPSHEETMSAVREALAEAIMSNDGVEEDAEWDEN